MFVSLLAPSDREDMTKRIMKMGETIDGCRTLKQLGYMRLIIQVGLLFVSPPSFIHDFDCFFNLDHA